MKVTLRSSILILLILFSFQLKSQISLGINWGVNYSNVRGEITDYLKPGICFGAFSSLKITEKFYFVPEIDYSEQGYLIHSLNGKLRNRLNYLNFPLLFTYRDLPQFHIELGPQIGYLIKYEGETGSSLLQMPKFDYGVDVGAKAFIVNGLFVNVRYYYGVSNLNRKYEGTNSLRNSTLAFSVGYSFNGHR